VVPTNVFSISPVAFAARGAHVICLWLDCDREGENICFEVLRVCEPVMAPHPRGLKAQRIFRAKFSSLVKFKFPALQFHCNC
jgi:DNA topoisomerase IA